MRKLLLLLVLTSALLFQTSCSKDDSPAEEAVAIGGTVTATIDGTVKTFDNVIVTEEVFDAGTPDEATELTIRAQTGSNVNEYIIFYLDKGDTGTAAIYGTYYFSDGLNYLDGSNFNTNVTTNNTQKKLVGTFFGELGNLDPAGGSSAVITNGSFNIQY